MAIHQVIAADIVTNRDRVPISCVVHGVFKAFGERSYAIAILTVVAILELLWNLDKPGWKKRGVPAGEITIQSSLAE